MTLTHRRIAQAALALLLLATAVLAGRITSTVVPTPGIDGLSASSSSGIDRGGYSSAALGDPVQYLNLGTSSFTSFGGDTTRDTGDADCRLSEDGESLFADVNLPDGVTIVEMRATFYRDSASEAGGIFLSYRDSATDPNAWFDVTMVDLADSDPTNDDYVTETKDTEHVVDNATYDYFIEVANSVGICAVRIGYLPPSPGALMFVPVRPCGIFDTRNDGQDKVGAGQTAFFATVDVSTFPQGQAACGNNDVVPIEAEAVQLNLVALAGESNGNLRIHAADSLPPAGGVVIFKPGQDNSNTVTISGDDAFGDVAVTVNGGPVHVRGVLLGYWIPYPG